MRSVVMFLKFLFLNAIFLGFSSAVSAAPFVYKENFDGLYVKQGLSKASNATYNNRGLIWTDGVRTSTRDINELNANFGINVPVVTNTAIDSSISVGRTGDINNGVLRFRYPPGINSFAEQRFTLAKSALDGRPGLTEFWIQYDIYIPSDFTERDVPKAWGTKVMALWPNKYEGNLRLIIGQTAVYAPGGKFTGDGSAYQVGDWRWHDPVQGKFIYDGVRDPAAKNQNPVPQFRIINTDKDRGKWTRRTFHIRLPNTAESKNGVLQMWVRHGDGSISKILDLRDVAAYGPNGENFIRNGYLLGWSNPGFTDSVKVFDSSLGKEVEAGKSTNFFMDNFILSERFEDVDGNAVTGFLPTPKSPPAKSAQP